MTAEQLSLLDLSPSPSPRRLLSRASAPEGSAHAVSAEGVAIELRFPEALVFLREVESEAVAVLLVLAAGAELADGRLVVRASTRGLAGRLGFLSKDTVHRRLRQLCRAGVLEPLPSTGPTEAPAYVLHLDGSGLTFVRPKSGGVASSLSRTPNAPAVWARNDYGPLCIGFNPVDTGP